MRVQTTSSATFRLAKLRFSCIILYIETRDSNDFILVIDRGQFSYHLATRLKKVFHKMLFPANRLLKFSENTPPYAMDMKRRVGHQTASIGTESELETVQKIVSHIPCIKL